VQQNNFMFDIVARTNWELLSIKYIE